MMRSGRIRRALRTRSRGDRALAFDVRRPGFQTDHVVLLELQFGRVLDGHDTFVVGMKLDSVLSSVVLPEPVPPEMRCSAGP